MECNISEPIGLLMVEPVRRTLGEDGVVISNIITDEYIHIPYADWVTIKTRIDKAMHYYDTKGDSNE